MKRLLTYGLLCFVVLLLLAVYLLSCNNGKEYLSSNLKDASSTGSIVLADLDDDSNPYKGQYKAWDRWVFEHAGAEDPYKIDKPLEEMTPEERQAFVLRSNYPSNWSERKATVLDGIYLIPYEISIANGHDAMARHEYEEYLNNLDIVTARGVMNPNLSSAMLDKSDEIMATFFMPIPEWLAENPPAAAMLLPNGDIVTDGLLGSTAHKNYLGMEDPSPCCGGQALYCLYNSSGELVRTNNRFWWFLYKNEDECPTGQMVVSEDGYVRFYDDSGNLNSIWDYDGTLLESEESATPRDPHNFQMISNTSLKKYFSASQN